MGLIDRFKRMKQDRDARKAVKSVKWARRQELINKANRAKVNALAEKEAIRTKKMELRRARTGRITSGLKGKAAKIKKRFAANSKGMQSGRMGRPTTTQSSEKDLPPFMRLR